MVQKETEEALKNSNTQRKKKAQKAAKQLPVNKLWNFNILKNIIPIKTTNFFNKNWKALY